ncbi:MAG TPA: MFS transporter [Burkholderiales bacterium]|nr:MFS transporter [Burkholderiales bacterium]
MASPRRISKLPAPSPCRRSLIRQRIRDHAAGRKARTIPERGGQKDTARPAEHPCCSTNARLVRTFLYQEPRCTLASPFLPAFVNERGVPPEQLGLVLAAGTAIRLLSAPLAGRIGDVLGALRLVLVACIALAAAVTLGYMPARGFWPFLAPALLHAAFLAPMPVLADALSLASSKREPFEYGWVRGTGSGAFIAGLLAGAARRRVPEISRERSARPPAGSP